MKHFLIATLIFGSMTTIADTRTVAGASKEKLIKSCNEGDTTKYDMYLIFNKEGIPTVNTFKLKITYAADIVQELYCEYNVLEAVGIDIYDCVDSTYGVLTHRIDMAGLIMGPISNYQAYEMSEDGNVIRGFTLACQEK